MRGRMRAVLAIGFGVGLLAADASATLVMQKKAKEAGFPATNCLYCHNEKLPKKGVTTHNARGEFLTAEKKKRNVKDCDMSWLKDYTEKEKAK